MLPSLLFLLTGLTCSVVSISLPEGADDRLSLTECDAVCIAGCLDDEHCKEDCQAKCVEKSTKKISEGLSISSFLENTVNEYDTPSKISYDPAYPREALQLAFNSERCKEIMIRIKFDSVDNTGRGRVYTITCLALDIPF